MTRKFRKISVTLLAIFVVGSFIMQSCGGEKKALLASEDNFEIISLGVGQDGTKVFKVYGVGKNVDQAIIKAKKNAVYACIFRGIPGANGSAPTPPIVTDSRAKETHQLYFDKFFETGGRYLQYVNVTTDGVPSGQDRLKVKEGYKVGISVQVLYNNLRKDLERDGIARGLSSGF